MLIIRTVFTVGIMLLLSGCQNLGGESLRTNPTLTVGVAVDVPPLSYIDKGLVEGLEIDLIREIAERNDWDVVFVQLMKDALIPALLAKDADVIMGGLVIKKKLRSQIKFTYPYTSSRLMALVRAEDEVLYGSVEKIHETNARVGIEKGSYADKFLKQVCEKAERVELSRPMEAPISLKKNEVDVFVHESHTVSWLADQYEMDLLALWLDDEKRYFSWGVRLDDTQRWVQLNQGLEEITKDGTLEKVLNRWLPYRNIETQ